MIVDDLTLAKIDPDTVDSSFVIDDSYAHSMDISEEEADELCAWYSMGESNDEEWSEDDTFSMDLLRRDCEELLDAVERIVGISGDIKFYNIARQQIQTMTTLLKHM